MFIYVGKAGEHASQTVVHFSIAVLMATIATMEEAYLQSRPPMSEGAGSKVPGPLVRNGTTQTAYTMPLHIRRAVFLLGNVRKRLTKLNIA